MRNKILFFLFIVWFTEALHGGEFLISREIDRKRVAAIHQISYEKYQEIFPFHKFEKKKNFEIMTPLKSGTHLLEKTLSLLIGNTASGRLMNYRMNGKLNPKEELPIQELDLHYFGIDHFYGENYFNYILYSKLPTLTIVRDPRDIILSMCFSFRDAGDSLWNQSSILERIVFLLNNPLYFGKASNIEFQWDCLIKLSEMKKNVLLVYFENLVGEKGGGNRLLQKKEIQEIANFLNIRLTNIQLDFLMRNIFGGNWGTFREGKIGSWVHYFTPEIKQLFKEKYNFYLIAFGYEVDDQW